MMRKTKNWKTKQLHHIISYHIMSESTYLQVLLVPLDDAHQMLQPVPLPLQSLPANVTDEARPVHAAPASVLYQGETNVRLSYHVTWTGRY